MAAIVDAVQGFAKFVIHKHIPVDNRFDKIVLSTKAAANDSSKLLHDVAMRAAHKALHNRRYGCAFEFFVLRCGMAKLAERTVLPPAHNANPDLRGLAEALEQQKVVLVGADGVEHTVPAEVRQVLAQVVHAMADGHAVTIATRGTVLTTQEAAEILGVSRPTLVKLLETGEIPFTKPGRHRRVQLSDLLDYQRRLREQRRSELAAMAHDAAEDDAYRVVDHFVQTR